MSALDMELARLDARSRAHQEEFRAAVDDLTCADAAVKAATVGPEKDAARKARSLAGDRVARAVEAWIQAEKREGVASC